MFVHFPLCKTYRPSSKHVPRTKLSLSHALSQSVKISLVSNCFGKVPLLTQRCSLFFQFEELISNTIEETKDIPEEISETGKVGMSHKGTIDLSYESYLLLLMLVYRLKRSCVRLASSFCCGQTLTLLALYLTHRYDSNTNTSSLRLY